MNIGKGFPVEAEERAFHGIYAWWSQQVRLNIRVTLFVMINAGPTILHLRFMVVIINVSKLGR